MIKWIYCRYYDILCRFLLKIDVSGVWHPRRSETRVNYRGSSHYEYKAIKKAIVKKYDCFFAYFCI